MLVWYGLSIMYGYSFAPIAPFRRQAVNKVTFILMTSLSDHSWMETERWPIVFLECNQSGHSALFVVLWSCTTVLRTVPLISQGIKPLVWEVINCSIIRLNNQGTMTFRTLEIAYLFKVTQANSKTKGCHSSLKGTSKPGPLNGDHENVLTIYLNFL